MSTTKKQVRAPKKLRSASKNLNFFSTDISDVVIKQKHKLGDLSFSLENDCVYIWCDNIGIPIEFEKLDILCSTLNIIGARCK